MPGIDLRMNGCPNERDGQQREQHRQQVIAGRKPPGREERPGVEDGLQRQPNAPERRDIRANAAG